MQPYTLSVSSGECTDDGGARGVGVAGDPAPKPNAVRVTGGTYNGIGVAISSSASDPAVHVSGTGIVNLTDGATITTTGDHGYGLEIESNGQVFADGLVITTAGEYSYGLQVMADGSFHAERLSITTAQHAADAITMNGVGAYVSLEDVEIVVHGDHARGIRLQNGAVVEGANVSITTTFENGDASEGQSHGIAVEGGSSVTLTDSKIAAAGNDSAGVEISGSTFVGTRVAISATGPGELSNGVYVGGPGSQLTLYESSVESAAIQAHALYAEGADVFLDDVDVSATGAGAHGLHLVDGGTIEAIDVDVSATGSGASAISMVRDETDDSGQITVTGGRLASTDGPLIFVEAGAGGITLNGPIALAPGLVGGRPVFASVTNDADRAADLDLTVNDVSGVTGLIEVTGTGNTLDARFNGSDWVGDLEALGNTANVDLDASTWLGRATNASNIDIDAFSAWNITGSSDATHVTNAGLLAFEPQVGTFLTLRTQEYVGQNGILRINTVLEADGAESDRLVIDGVGATGTTGIVVANAGGGGALTLADGILVVDVINGTTDPGAFHLASRAAAGAYEYLLFQGGESDDQDWFLRSYLIEDPDDVVPLYRPEVPLYSPVPALARQFGLAHLGTLHERVGEQMNIESRPDQDDRFNGVWARLIGEHGSNSWSGPFDVSARNIGIVGAQGGLDIYRAEDQDGNRDHIGVYASYALQHASISGIALGDGVIDVGDLTIAGPAVGGYWTHYSAQGTYLDAVVQANLFGVDARSDYDAQLRTSGHGFVVSLEAGHPIAFGEGWQIEPQAQLIYQTLSVANGADAFSSVAWQAGDSLTGRLGARVQYTSEDDEALWQPYAKVNLWHGFGGTDGIVLGGSPSYESRYGHTSLELGAGLTARVTDTASLYGHVDHRWSLDGDERPSAIQGAVGVRVNW